jgi:hypothetical protein
MFKTNFSVPIAFTRFKNGKETNSFASFFEIKKEGTAKKTPAE